MALFGLFISSLIIHFTPALIERGIAPGEAARIASTLGVATICGRICVGWMLDCWSPTMIGAVSFGASALGLIGFAISQNEIVVLSVFCLGFMIGAEINLMSFLTLRYFGVAAYGAIFGLMFAFYSIASVVGLFLNAILVTAHGSSGLFLAAALAFVVAACLLLILGKIAALDQPPIA